MYPVVGVLLDTSTSSCSPRVVGWPTSRDNINEGWIANRTRVTMACFVGHVFRVCPQCLNHMTAQMSYTACSGHAYSGQPTPSLGALGSAMSSSLCSYSELKPASSRLLDIK